MDYLISYAQNFEDIMLWRALGHVEHGRYIDVGAQSPHVDSVSKVFYEHGWRGIHVEPMPMYADELRRARPDETVIQAAVARVAGVLPFFEFPDTGLSTTDRGIGTRHIDAGFAGKDSVVAAVTLDDVLARGGAAGADVHWLKIDIEGGEYDALRGWKDDSILPWVVVVESTQPLTATESYGDWEPLLLGKGYRFAYFDGLNRFYVSPQHPGLLDAFKAGPNLFDGFALGGAANSPFCSRLNEQMKQLREETAAALEASSQQRTQAEREGAERIVELQAASALLEQAAATERADHQRRERDLIGQLAVALQRELALAGQVKEAMQRELEAFGKLDSVRNEHQRLSDEHRLLRDEHALAKTRLQHHQEAAHRWWLAAERLRRDLDEVLGSHSWRATAPLRNLRRNVSAVRAGARQRLRAIVVRGMRKAIATPFLRRPAVAVLGLQPSLKQRLRGLARNEGLIEGGDSPVHAVGGGSAGCACPPGVQPRRAPALSRQARKVLDDLEQAIEEHRH